MTNHDIVRPDCVNKTNRVLYVLAIVRAHD